MIGFGERVRRTFADFGRLCVGIDPHEQLLTQWGLPASAAGVREFGLRAVDAAIGRVGFVKPQVSFFERWGSGGYAALEEVMSTARAAGLVVIADAKRGDIGTTMDAYADAWLTPGAPLEADAVTANPFLGVGTLAHTFDLAETQGKGVFVLAATSNPDAFTAQRATLPSGATVSAGIIEEVSRRNAAHTPDGHWAPLGFVVGATVEWTSAGLTPPNPPAPILGPGFGFQGGEAAHLLRYGDAAETVIASESRSILSAGPHDLASRITQRATLYRRSADV